MDQNEKIPGMGKVRGLLRRRTIMLMARAPGLRNEIINGFAVEDRELL
jgi:hypothetical protein